MKAVTGTTGAGVVVAALLALSPPCMAAEPGEVVSSLWNALASDPGKGADAAALQRLFHPEARIWGATWTDGQPVLTVTTAAEFIRRQAEPGGKGFYECEIERDVTAHGEFAAVYSVVESRSDRSALAADFTGLNSLQLHRDAAGRWTILSLYYHVGPPGVAVPLRDGRPGLCLNRE